MSILFLPNQVRPITMAAGEGEPQLKKLKLDEYSPFFIKFIEDKEKLARLRYAITALNEGYNRMNLILIKIVEANARSSASFTKATCNTVQCKTEVFVAASIFQKGLDVLERYVQSDELINVPADDQQRKALYNLLKFLSEGKYDSANDPL